MPGRKYNSAEYRYGFNGKEKDDEGEFGSITNYDYGFRIYNPAIGKFLSVDPLSGSFPHYTPYQFSGNKPIFAIDLDGLEELPWFLTKNNRGGPPVLTFGIGKLETIDRRVYVPGFRFHNTNTFIFNSVVGPYNGFVTNWNAERVGADGQNLHQTIAQVSDFLHRAEISDYQALANDVRTYESLAGALALGFITKKITGPRTVGPVRRSSLARQTDEMVQYVWDNARPSRGYFGPKLYGYAESRADIFEQTLSTTKYSGARRVGDLDNGLFPTIDFVENGVGISLKTTKATKSGSKTFAAIKRNIDRLAQAMEDGFVKGRSETVSVNEARLDIAVPKGYDRSSLSGVLKYAKEKNVKVEIFHIEDTY